MITVIGVGNPVMGDDGAGLAVLRRLQGITNDLDWVPRLSTSDPAAPNYIDGGTSGMELLPIVQDADKLLLLDAVTGPGASGDVVRLHGDQIPRLLSSRLSPHQVGLLDLLSAARLLGREPNEVAVVGIVVEHCDLHVGLSQAVSDAIDPATDAARDVIAEWQRLEAAHAN